MFVRPHPLVIWLGLVLLTAMTSVGRTAPPVSIRCDQSDPAVAFAADELRQALVGRGHDVTVASDGGAVDAAEGLLILLTPTTDRHALDALEAAGGDSPQDLKAEGFGIRRTRHGNATVFWVLAADTAGLMYGALDLAEVVRCHGLDGVKEVVQNPYMALRGIKYNCPLDERTPTYHAHGGEAQWNNVAVMWEMDFWKEYIDQLARFRYNYLSLWNLHPFPSMVRVPGYEKVALDDVQTTTGTIRMTMDEKIAFWREVMRYAKERNVDIYVVTWNIFVLGTDGQYGLTNKFDNPTTTDYFRKSVKQMFLTYPDLAGVGLTTGERMPNMSSEQKEDWAFATYGQGVLDAATEQPDRKITLIHRQHQTGALDIAARFQELVDHPNIDFLFSFKYAKAHVMSSTRQPYCDEFVKEIAGLETIWTLRNDSNYYFRWGAPDFVREFIQNIPYDVSRGYYYGSDGHTWGREFLSNSPTSPRELDITKHWYHWMLWGRLGYDPTLSNDRLVAILAVRFPEVDAEKLFTAWQEASMVYPVVTGFHWGALDFQWYIEACISRSRVSNTESGFHDIERFITLETHPGTDNLTIPEYVQAVVGGDEPQGTTPLEVSQQVHAHADRALKIVDRFEAVEEETLDRTLGDIRAMATLGKYYAHKIHGATELALYRQTGDESRKAKALDEMIAAAGYWDRYLEIALAQYVNPIHLNRVGKVDWQALTAEVKKDIEIVKNATPNK